MGFFRDFGVCLGFSGFSGFRALLGVWGLRVLGLERMLVLRLGVSGFNALRLGF